MNEVKITPLARRLAEENGINWRQLKGTGPDGTVVERDILAFLAKVMAGEVNLPPAPEETPPSSSAIPDMTQAQALLQKEGVQLSDLIPSSQSVKPALPTLEDIEFDLDLDSIAPPVPPAAAALEETPTPVREPEVVPNFNDFDEAARSRPSQLPPLQWEEPEPPSSAAAEDSPASTSLPFVSSLEPPSSPSMPARETQEVLVDLGTLTPPLPLQAGLRFTNASALPDLPTPHESHPPEATPAAPPTMLRVQAWQRLVAIGPAQEAAHTLSEAWRTEVGLEALLYRAADKALADTETPLRPTKGQLEGSELKSLRVAPSHSLRGTLDSLRMASEPAEGLVVLSLADSAFDQVIFPGRSTLTLGRASGGYALLSLSGEMSTELAGKLLERIAYYLERPILLA